MILHDEIRDLVVEWTLREDVIEKDYVLSWLLWGIGSDPILSEAWIFKGGTCLKKCFIETYRFSEDLDFTVLPNGPITPEEVTPLVENMLSRVYDESGIDFSIRLPRFRSRKDPGSTEGRIYYRGPRQSPGPPIQFFLLRAHIGHVKRLHLRQRAVLIADHRVGHHMSSIVAPAKRPPIDRRIYTRVLGKKLRALITLRDGLYKI